MQATNSILMIRPVDFAFNEQTAENNVFQVKTEEENIQKKALNEFDNFAGVLRNNGVNVTVINDTPSPHTPDSIFPNNWVSFHDSGTVFLYPMFAENRRSERRKDIIDSLANKFQAKKVVDLSVFENLEKYLEGTGSMVLDRDNKLAYACLSPRTSADVLNEFCQRTGYRPIVFNANDEQGTPIYHTNVMMCVGSHFVVICLEAITDSNERKTLTDSFILTHKEVIEITFEQMHNFAGNMLELKNGCNETLIVMSGSAYEALRADQRLKLEHYGKLAHSPIDTIEKAGGGSARCMIAEIHLPVKG